MNGFLLIDKAGGVNSFKLVIALRKIANQKRVGYAGTLDPLATGLMVLALGEYTKLLPYLEAQDKVYEVGILFGKESDTFDLDGQLREVSHYEKPLEQAVGKILLEKFVGKIEQVPPRFSAIKISGKRAYQMARDGQQFEMKKRPVEIFSTEILEYKFPRLRLRMHCSSGTYIRSLAHDLGVVLGCGGLVETLRRIAVGGLGVENSLPLEKINTGSLSGMLVDPKIVFADKKFVQLSAEQHAVLARGNFIDNTFLNPGEEALAMLDGQIAGVLETILAGSELKFRRMLNIT